ncbi:cytochrome c peroxidase [Microbulbifer sp. VAAC004]|uniref:cytochrome c peroxidase n=1 Tax=unclassified Microbulbifer TaxID=2619833 RepID=UPI004039B969
MKTQSNNLPISCAALLRLVLLPLVLLAVGCSSGSSGGDDSSGSETVEADTDAGGNTDTNSGGDDTGNDGDTDNDDDAGNGTETGQGIAPKALIANAFSGTSIGLSWQRDGATYAIYRGGEKIAETDNHFYVDQGLSINTEYSYSVTSGDVNSESETARVNAKTLINNTNGGLNNGAVATPVLERLVNISECKNVRSALNLLDEDLDTCLAAMLESNNLAGHLEDMRAFAARVRSEQDPAMVELGMRLFYSQSLSANGDVACASCHHAAIGCGGDNLSMPVGVNPLDPALVGPGRSDGINEVPIVPRNAQPICNVALWGSGLFWDNRVALNDRGIRTDSRDVSFNTEAAVGTGTLALMMAQAHFPVTNPAEMGDVTQFGYDASSDSGTTDYREDIVAANLGRESWSGLFNAAFGDDQITFSRIAQAIAAFEAVQLFIDNPFFDYVDGDLNALDNDEKRGAITFMSGNSGCTNCHAGAFFTTEGPRPANYPQIGIGTDENGSGADLGANGAGAFRPPTLLNVALTGPWGHSGQFETLRRNVEHYRDRAASVNRYYTNNEMCDLSQFSGLTDCASKVAPNGLALSQAILATTGGDAGNNLSDAEIDLVVRFLETLTDPDAANTSSNSVRALIPTRDGGPDGKQLDARDSSGKEL